MYEKELSAGAGLVAATFVRQGRARRGGDVPGDLLLEDGFPDYALGLRVPRRAPDRQDIPSVF